jgi:hypothetical protein
MCAVAPKKSRSMRALGHCRAASNGVARLPAEYPKRHVALGLVALLKHSTRTFHLSVRSWR